MKPSPDQFGVRWMSALADFLGRALQQITTLLAGPQRAPVPIPVRVNDRRRRAPRD
jgi:hypothetical protein